MPASDSAGSGAVLCSQGDDHRKFLIGRVDREVLEGICSALLVKQRAHQGFSAELRAADTMNLRNENSFWFSEIR